jgi:hypothetical protein
MTPLRPLPRLAPLLGVCALAACGDGDRGAAPADVKRPPAVLEFEGYVYSHPDATDLKIVQQVRAETRSAFTALRKARVMVSRREVESTGTENFKKEPVTAVDRATGDRRQALRVRYRYVARPDIAHDLSERKELPLALLQRESIGDAERVLRECTKNTEQDKGFVSAVALIFDASLESCKAAVQAEQATIDAARAQLPGASSGAKQADESVIPMEELERLYLPITVTLDLKRRTPGEVTPRYAPFSGEKSAEEPAAQEGSDDDVDPPQPLEPAKVIVDPDLAPHVRQPEEKPGEPETVLPPGGKSERNEPTRLPSVVSVPQSQQVHRVVESKEPEQHFDIPLETLADPKFIIIWLSLLLAYPILRSERKKK